MSRYKSISIPRELYEAIQSYITAHPERGYVSVQEYAREALRQGEFINEALAEYARNHA
jgi:hypothetical protein